MAKPNPQLLWCLPRWCLSRPRPMPARPVLSRRPCVAGVGVGAVLHLVLSLRAQRLWWKRTANLHQKLRWPMCPPLMSVAVAVAGAGVLWWRGTHVLGWRLYARIVV